VDAGVDAVGYGFDFGEFGHAFSLPPSPPCSESDNLMANGDGQCDLHG
jgi:hypothetical protein